MILVSDIHSEANMWIHSYANMVFIVFFTLMTTILSYLVFSYDIACQWS
jgi:hypothetical protein